MPGAIGTGKIDWNIAGFDAMMVKAEGADSISWIRPNPCRRVHYRRWISPALDTLRKDRLPGIQENGTTKI
jgi:hypothetical protein